MTHSLIGAWSSTLEPIQCEDPVSTKFAFKSNVCRYGVERNPLLLAISHSFSLLDSVGGGLSVAENPSLVGMSRSFLVLRGVVGLYKL